VVKQCGGRPLAVKESGKRRNTVIGNVIRNLRRGVIGEIFRKNF